MTSTQEKLLQEKAKFASELVTQASNKQLFVRVFGGLAFWMTCPTMRCYFDHSSDRKGDIDLYHPDSCLRTVQWFLTTQRFQVETQTSGAMSKIRAIKEGFVTEVFTGPFRFSHQLHFESKRLLRVSPTLPPTELLLSKLQIHDFTSVDARDVLMLLAEDMSTAYRGRLNKAVITRDVMHDWGLTQDVLANLETTRVAAADAIGLPRDASSRAHQKIEAIIETIMSCRKTCVWTVRKTIGIGKGYYPVA